MMEMPADITDLQRYLDVTVGLGSGNAESYVEFIKNEDRVKDIEWAEKFFRVWNEFPVEFVSEISQICFTIYFNRKKLIRGEKLDTLEKAVRVNDFLWHISRLKDEDDKIKECDEKIKMAEDSKFIAKGNRNVIGVHHTITEFCDKGEKWLNENYYGVDENPYE